jgi:hypothetical protein
MSGSKERLLPRVTENLKLDPHWSNGDELNGCPLTEATVKAVVDPAAEALKNKLKGKK